MSGYDAPFHLSEECTNANMAGPRAIVMTAQFGLYMGWAIILVIVYCVKDIGEVVGSEYGQPFGSLCLQVLGKVSHRLRNSPDCNPWKYDFERMLTLILTTSESRPSIVLHQHDCPILRWPRLHDHSHTSRLCIFARWSDPW